MENQLADKLGVSRTPVREALRMLELENLVELVPRYKTFFQRKLPFHLLHSLFRAAFVRKKREHCRPGCQ